MDRGREPGTAPADAIEEIASRLDRLSVSRHDPERFFEERSELAHLLRKEAWKLRGVRRSPPHIDTGKR